MENEKVYLGELPEFVAVEPNWLADWRKNFGTHKLRLEIIDYFLPREEDYEQYYPSKGLDGQRSMYKDEFKELVDLYDLLYSEKFTDEEMDKSLDKITQKYNKRYDEEVKAANKLVSKKKADRIATNINPYIARIYNIWNLAGRTKLTDKKNLIANLFGLYINPGNKNRASINPFTNTAYSIHNFHNAVAEMAHPIQEKYGNRNKWYHYIIDTPETIYEETIGNKTHYRNPNHFEYETHSVIEPKLLDYIKGREEIPYGEEIVKTYRKGSKLIPRKK